jgi:uncharacterized protein YdbL (DUF1318 family)
MKPARDLREQLATNLPAFERGVTWTGASSGDHPVWDHAHADVEITERAHARLEAEEVDHCGNASEVGEALDVALAVLDGDAQLLRQIAELMGGSYRSIASTTGVIKSKLSVETMADLIRLSVESRQYKAGTPAIAEPAIASLEEKAPDCGKRF